MAVELRRFITEQLARLPEHHPDRPFLSALQGAVSAYAERAAPPATAAGIATLPQAEAEVTPDAGAAAPPLQPGERQEQERVTFAGRVGTAPAYQTTTKGRFIARFSVAEHVEGQEKPIWHTVFAFDDRARKLREKGLARGAPVEVVGYKHERQIKGRDGKTKVAEDIYAVAVRTH